MKEALMRVVCLNDCLCSVSAQFMELEHVRAVNELPLRKFFWVLHEILV